MMPLGNASFDNVCCLKIIYGGNLHPLAVTASMIIQSTVLLHYGSLNLNRSLMSATVLCPQSNHVYLKGDQLSFILFQQCLGNKHFF
jgi:hypothetical protein